MLARHAWRAVDDCRSAREPGGRGRLGYAIADEKGFAGCQLRMARRVCHAEHGRHAGIAVAEYLRPLLLWARGVVDRDHRVFGYQNLLICDGAVIPANPGVNPSLTITAMAERAMAAIPVKPGTHTTTPARG